MAKNEHVSLSVIRRLPRYYRFLADLLRAGTTRIPLVNYPIEWV